MTYLTDFAISGAGVHDLGANTNVLDIGVKITAFPTDVDIIDSNYPERVARVGWIALGSDYSVDLITVEPIYCRPVWIDFTVGLITVPTEEVGARYIRWWLRGAATGHIRVDT